MACLNISSGLFINSDPNLLWKSANATETAPNGTQIELDNSAPTPGITVTHGGDTEFFQKFPGGQIHYMRFGNPANYILILNIQSSGNRTVTLVDTSSSSGILTQSILFVSEPSTVSLPVVHRSQNNGSLFFIYAPSNTGNITNVQICRSDNGLNLCSALPFSPSAQVTAEVTATSLLIKEGGSNRASCPKPTPTCDVIPNTRTFPDAVLGAGVDPALSSHIEQFTIQNTGTDCLIINGISNAGPFSVQNPTMPFPVTLDPTQSFMVDVLFAPASLGNYSEHLPINPTPSDGDIHLECIGEARSPEITITFAAVIGFGRVALGSVGNRNLVITNNGEASVNINIPGSPSGIPFEWAAFSGAIPVSNAQTIPITFNPVIEGTANHTLTFTSNANGSPHSVQLTGEGCVANAEIDIQVPAGPFIDFGNVQRGFRTIRIVRVRNNGDGPLNFDAGIQGADAVLFGLQLEDSSITSPASNLTFTVNPISPCGPVASGPGEVLFGVTFYANDTPGVYNAQLVVNNHNATNTSEPSFTFDLQAEIIPLVNIDVELVLDRSGSMSGSSGERSKIDTAIDAGRLFVQLSRPGVEDRIGLVRFNVTPEVLSGFSIQNITAGNQNNIANTINSSNYNPAGGTAIAGGVRVAIKDIDNNPRTTLPAELNTAVVVLTDGHDNTPYTDPDDGITYTLLGEDGTTALPTPTGKRIYAVGIGDSIDVGRLSILAQATGGEFLHVHSFSGLDYFKLEKHFTQIYMDSVDLAVISDPTFYINSSETHKHDFDVLRGDLSFMIVIYDRQGVRIPFYLKAPNGEIVDLTSIPSGYQIRPGITNTARFLEVKMPQGEPTRYAGKWQVVVFHDSFACFARNSVNDPDFKEFSFGFRPGNCKEYDKPILYGISIGVGSNFRMTPFVQPGIIKMGEPIALNALIGEFGLPVLNCDVTVDAKAPDGMVTHHVLKDDGNHSDDDADDGNYGRIYTLTGIEGAYEFTFRAYGFSRDGEPVVREAVRSKYVEGRVPLIPTAPNDGRQPDECCNKITRILWITTTMVALAVIILLMLMFKG